MHPAGVVVTERVPRLYVEVRPLGRKGLGEARAVGGCLLRTYRPSHYRDDDRTNRHARTGDGEAVETAVRCREVDGVRGLLRRAGVGGVAYASNRHLRLQSELGLHGGVGRIGAHAFAAAGETESLDLEGGHGRNHSLVIGAVIGGRVEELVRGLHHELRRPHCLGDLVVAGASAVDFLIETVAAREITCRRVRPGVDYVEQGFGEHVGVRQGYLQAGYPRLFKLHGMRKDTTVSTK